MKWIVTGALALLACGASQAETCAGGLYLNPEVVRGELTARKDSAARDLGEFLRATGLPTVPVLNVRDGDEVARIVKTAAQPPCWVYGNPVVGLASGYRPVAVNQEAIVAAVLLVGDAGTAPADKPAAIESLPPPDRAQALALLKKTECFGIRGGVTTALVKTEQLCASVTELTPQQGLGQSFLVTKAAFAWKPGHPVGVITRVQSALGASMDKQEGGDARLHSARLVVVPTRQASWGYGLYVRESLADGDAAKKAAKLLGGLTNPDVALARALDIGKNFKFEVPAAAEIDRMRSAIQAP